MQTGLCQNTPPMLNSMLKQPSQSLQLASSMQHQGLVLRGYVGQFIFFQNGEMLVATFFIIIYHLKQSLWQRAYAHSLFFPEAHPLYEAED